MRLKIPSAMLTNPSQPISAPSWGWLTNMSIPMIIAPISRLAAGPAAAIRASSRGVRESASIDVTPPKMKSVIPSTLRPNRRATIACESSCASTDTKKSAAVATATIQYWLSVQPGNWRGNWDPAREYVIRNAITSHDGWIEMSMPASRPTFQPDPMRPSLDQAGSGVCGDARHSR